MPDHETTYLPEIHQDSGGLFSTPLGAAMLSGVIAGMLNVANWLVLSSNQGLVSEVYRHFGAAAFTVLYFLPMVATYSGPAIARRSVPLLAGAIFVAIVYSIFNTVVNTLVMSILSPSSVQAREFMWIFFAVNHFFSTIVSYMLLSKLYGGSWFNIWFVPIAFILVFPIMLLYPISNNETRDADALRIMAMLVLPIIRLLPQAFIVEREIQARNSPVQQI